MDSWAWKSSGESASRMTSSAQVGESPKNGPMWVPNLADSRVHTRLFRCNFYSPVEGIIPCPNPCLSATSWLQGKSIQTQTLVFRISSANIDQVASPLVVKNSVCKTKSNAFCTSMVETYVSWAQSLLLTRNSVHIMATMGGDSFGIIPNWSLCWARALRRVCLMHSNKMCSNILPTAWCKIILGNCNHIPIGDEVECSRVARKVVSSSPARGTHT